MKLSIVNSLSGNKCTQKVDAFVKKVDAKRKVVEDARRSRVERIHNDLKDVFQREKEYTKQVIEQLVPVKIIWDEEGLDRLMSLIPFRFEMVNKQELVHEAEVMDEDEEKLEESI